MIEQSPVRFLRNSAYGSLILLGQLVQKVFGQMLDVVETFAKRRHSDFNCVDPIVEILAQTPFVDGLDWVPVR